MSMTDVTLYEKMKCAERELRLRQWNYKHLIAKGKLTQAKADYQLTCMQAIAEEYRAQWDGVVPVLVVDDGYLS